MNIEDLLTFERIEAQELVGHLDILEKFSKDKGYTVTIDKFPIQNPMIVEILKRDTLYRSQDLNTRKNKMTDEHKLLYSQIKKRVKCDPTIYIKNIPLYDAVNSELHFPCLMVYEDGLYGANFSDEPLLYIFNTRDVLYNLVLDGYILPINVQNGLGISQRINEQQKKKNFKRDLMVQTIAHILFSLNNKNLRWDQTLLANLDVIKNFSLSASLSERGGKRPLRDAIQKIIPESVRKKGNSKLKNFTPEELNMSPLIIPQVVFNEDNGGVSIDFSALRIILRTALFVKRAITPEGTNISEQEFLNLPVLKQLISSMNPNEWLVCKYELLRFSQKFGHLKFSF